MTRKNRVGLHVLALSGLLLAPAAGRAGDREFHAIVERIQAHYHKRPMRFMGLLSFIANRVQPEGIRNIRLAIFEGLDSSRHPAAPDLDTFMQGIAGAEFRPFVRVRSRRDGEQTFVYAKGSGRDLELLVVTLDQDEACVVKMKVDPEGIRQWVDNPPGMSRKTPASHGGAR